MSRSVLQDVRAFWDANPCAANLSADPDRVRYFTEIAERRYASKPYIWHSARFDAFRGRRVLEIGCGIGLDGASFARGGARYVGVDLSSESLRLAREQFDLFGLPGGLLQTNAERMPFADASVDHVYSHGVLQHSPDTEAIVAEMHRVLRPGGTFHVMVYNRSSINYWIEIMFLRRVLRWLLRPRAMPRLVSRATGLPEQKLARHREILRSGRRMSTQEWLSINTDGPDNPLAKVYGRREAARLFRAFREVRTGVRFFDAGHWPFVGPALPSRTTDWLGRRWGFHRLVQGRK